VKCIRWAGHVDFIGMKRGAYRSFVEKSTEKISFGRPRYRWEGNIKIGVKK
jgi:hypothetical protein